MTAVEVMSGEMMSSSSDSASSKRPSRLMGGGGDGGEWVWRAQIDEIMRVAGEVTLAGMIEPRPRPLVGGGVENGDDVGAFGNGDAGRIRGLARNVRLDLGEMEGDVGGSLVRLAAAVAGSAAMAILR